jgi:virginiamycin A acetyltransferase
MPCSIGKYCAIVYDLTIISADHDMKRTNIQLELMTRIGLSTNFMSKGSVIIGNNVWIGDRVLILSGAHISDGSVIGAGSIVTKNCPLFSIVAGSPAKIIKIFSDSIITQLMNIKWWDWPEDKMR